MNKILENNGHIEEIGKYDNIPSVFNVSTIQKV